MLFQDGTFSLADFSEAFQEIEVQRVIRAYENGISMDIHCSPEGDWNSLPKESFARYCKVRINPNDVLTSGSPSISSFIDYISPFLIPAEIETLLESSDVVGNIRFSHPTLYVFPGGQGDAALFGINGFNMLLDGGFSRKSCFWDFVRHLDRLDAVLLTRLNNSNVNGISAVLRRKKQNAVYPQIGHFFCNIPDKKALLSPDGDKDKDPLLINILEEGHDIISNLQHLSLTPQSCYRDSEPINLYHKVGHGTLDMYVLSPARDSKEVREFMQKWNNNDQKLFSYPKNNKEFAFPLQNLVSICALLVWQPANPEDNITRILYPGSSPQQKIFEGLDKIKHLGFIKHPVCSENSLTPSVSATALKAKSIVDRIVPEQKATKKILENKQREKVTKESDVKSNKLIENGDTPEIIEKQIKKSDSTDGDKIAPKVQKPKKLDTEKEATEKTEEKQKTKIKEESKLKADAKAKQRSESQQRKPKPPEKKASPTTPKKTIDSKINGETPKPKSVGKSSPQATPAKSAKEASNRKVVESRYKQTAKPAPKPVPEKKEIKQERKTVTRKTKEAPSGKPPSSPLKKVNGVAKSEAITRKARLDKEGTTDSSTVSTPSADQESILKKDISKLTPEEIEKLKAQELADLKEEQEVVKEIEAVFRKGEIEVGKYSDLRKIKDLSVEEKEKEEYLVIEKEEIIHEPVDTKEDEIVKLTRDSEESEKQKAPEKIEAKVDVELKHEDQETVKETTTEVTKATEPVTDLKEKVAASKEESIASPEDKVDTSSERKTNDRDAEEYNKEIVESQPDEKVSGNVESGATTTAPTLPEDERIPLDEIKEDNGDPAVEEKYVKEETKEKDVPVIQLPPKPFETIAKLPPVVGIRLDKHSNIRDIVKTPDEVADLPVHEEVDIHNYEEYHVVDSSKEITQDDKFNGKEERKEEIKRTAEPEIATEFVPVGKEVEGTGDKVIETLPKTIQAEAAKVEDPKGKLETFEEAKKTEKVEKSGDKKESAKTVEDKPIISAHKKPEFHEDVTGINEEEALVRPEEIKSVNEMKDEISAKPEESKTSENDEIRTESKIEGDNLLLDKEPVVKDDKKVEMFAAVVTEGEVAKPKEKKESEKHVEPIVRDENLVSDKEEEKAIDEKQEKEAVKFEDLKDIEQVEKPTFKDDNIAKEELDKDKDEQVEKTVKLDAAEECATTEKIKEGAELLKAAHEKEIVLKDEGKVKEAEQEKKTVELEETSKADKVDEPIIEEVKSGKHSAIEKGGTVQDADKKDLVEIVATEIESTEEKHEKVKTQTEEEGRMEDPLAKEESNDEGLIKVHEKLSENKEAEGQAKVVSVEQATSIVEVMKVAREDDHKTIQDAQGMALIESDDKEAEFEKEILAIKTEVKLSSTDEVLDVKDSLMKEVTKAEELKEAPPVDDSNETTIEVTKQTEEKMVKQDTIIEPSFPKPLQVEDMLKDEKKDEAVKEFSTEDITKESKDKEQVEVKQKEQIAGKAEKEVLTKAVEEDARALQKENQHDEEKEKIREQEVLVVEVTTSVKPGLSASQEKASEKLKQEEEGVCTLKLGEDKEFTVQAKTEEAVEIIQKQVDETEKEAIVEKADIEKKEKQSDVKPSEKELQKPDTEMSVSKYAEEITNEITAEKGEVATSEKQEKLAAVKHEDSKESEALLESTGNEQDPISDIKEPLLERTPTPDVTAPPIAANLIMEKEPIVENKLYGKSDEVRKEIKQADVGALDEKKTDKIEIENDQSEKEQVSTENLEKLVEIKQEESKETKLSLATTAKEEALISDVKELLKEHKPVAEVTSMPSITAGLILKEEVILENQFDGKSDEIKKELKQSDVVVLDEKQADKIGIGGDDFGKEQAHIDDQKQKEDDGIQKVADKAVSESHEEVDTLLAVEKREDTAVISEFEKDVRVSSISGDVDKDVCKAQVQGIVATTIDKSKIEEEKTVATTEVKSIDQEQSSEIKVQKDTTAPKIEPLCATESGVLDTKDVRDEKMISKKDEEEPAEVETPKKLHVESSDFSYTKPADPSDIPEQEQKEKLITTVTAVPPSVTIKEQSDKEISQDSTGPPTKDEKSEHPEDTSEKISETNDAIVKSDEKMIVKAVQQDAQQVAEVDRKLQELKCKVGEVSDVASTEIKATASEIKDTSIRKSTEFIEKVDLGSKSPKEREEDVAKIVATVAEVLKSDAPLEELEEKVFIAGIPSLGSYTTQLRETHITTQDSPASELMQEKKDKHEAETSIQLKDEKLVTTAFLDQERKLVSDHFEKTSNLIQDSKELMQETSKMIADIKSGKPPKAESKPLEKTDSSESGIVHRMLVTASSEDGGEETVLCPAGSIMFSRSSESSGRSSPEIQSDSVSTVKSSIDLRTAAQETVEDSVPPSECVLDKIKASDKPSANVAGKVGYDHQKHEENEIVKDRSVDRARDTDADNINNGLALDNGIQDAEKTDKYKDKVITNDTEKEKQELEETKEKSEAVIIGNVVERDDKETDEKQEEQLKDVSGAIVAQEKQGIEEKIAEVGKDEKQEIKDQDKTKGEVVNVDAVKDVKIERALLDEINGQKEAADDQSITTIQQKDKGEQKDKPLTEDIEPKKPSLVDSEKIRSDETLEQHIQKPSIEAAEDIKLVDSKFSEETKKQDGSEMNALKEPKKDDLGKGKEKQDTVFDKEAKDMDTQESTQSKDEKGTDAQKRDLKEVAVISDDVKQDQIVLLDVLTTIEPSVHLLQDEKKKESDQEKEEPLRKDTKQVEIEDKEEIKKESTKQEAKLESDSDLRKVEVSSAIPSQKSVEGGFTTFQKEDMGKVQVVNTQHEELIKEEPEESSKHTTSELKKEAPIRFDSALDSAKSEVKKVEEILESKQVEEVKQSEGVTATPMGSKTETEEQLTTKEAKLIEKDADQTVNISVKDVTQKKSEIETDKTESRLGDKIDSTTESVPTNISFTESKTQSDQQILSLSGNMLEKGQMSNADSVEADKECSTISKGSVIAKSETVVISVTSSVEVTGKDEEYKQRDLSETSSKRGVKEVDLDIATPVEILAKDSQQKDEAVVESKHAEDERVDIFSTQRDNVTAIDNVEGFDSKKLDSIASKSESGSIGAIETVKGIDKIDAVKQGKDDVTTEKSKIETDASEKEVASFDKIDSKEAKEKCGVTDTKESATILSTNVVTSADTEGKESGKTEPLLTTKEEGAEKATHVDEVKVALLPTTVADTTAHKEQKEDTKSEDFSLASELSDSAGPSKRKDSLISHLSPSKTSAEELNLSGKSTPDIADVERMREMQEILKHEKHIPGSSTPPTVPVSPVVKDDGEHHSTASDSSKADVKKGTDMSPLSSLKDAEVRSITPASDDYERSDISSGQVSRAPNVLDIERNDSEEDVPGSPSSITSQLAHSHSTLQYEFEAMQTKIDPMNVSFYGSLPDESSVHIHGEQFLDEADMDFEKAMHEHRQTRGEDLGREVSSSYLFEVTKAKYSAPDSSGSSSVHADSVPSLDQKKTDSLMMSSFIGELPSGEQTETEEALKKWGKPLGLPSPAPPNDNKGTPKKERKLPPYVTAKNKINDDKKRAESPSKHRQKKVNAIYVDLTYVPHHGNSNYSYVDFFKRVRARYYVFSGIEPSKEVYNALLEAKQTWDDKDLGKKNNNLWVYSLQYFDVFRGDHNSYIRYRYPRLLGGRK